MNAHGHRRPVIALARGDPAGVSPELTAAALDEVRASANLVVIDDRRVFDEGARIAGVKPDLKTVAPDGNSTARRCGIRGSGASRSKHCRARYRQQGRRVSCPCQLHRHALTLARNGHADGVLHAL